MLACANAYSVRINDKKLIYFNPRGSIFGAGKFQHFKLDLYKINQQI